MTKEDHESKHVGEDKIELEATKLEQARNLKYLASILPQNGKLHDEK